MDDIFEGFKEVEGSKVWALLWVGKNSPFEFFIAPFVSKYVVVYHVEGRF